MSVQDGIVTLRGKVAHSFEKTVTENIVWRMEGVRAIVDEIEVKPLRADERTDSDIAVAALRALDKNLTSPQEFKLTVDEGWITLGGQTNWDTENITAQRIISTIAGVKGVTSNVAVRMKERRSALRYSSAHRDW